MDASISCWLVPPEKPQAELSAAAEAGEAVKKLGDGGAAMVATAVAAAAHQEAAAAVDKLGTREAPTAAAAAVAGVGPTRVAALLTPPPPHAVQAQLPVQRDQCRDGDQCQRGDQCPWRHPTDGQTGARPVDACLTYFPTQRRRQKKKSGPKTSTAA